MFPTLWMSVLWATEKRAPPRPTCPSRVARGPRAEGARLTGGCPRSAAHPVGTATLPMLLMLCLSPLSLWHLGTGHVGKSGRMARASRARRRGPRWEAR